MLLDTQTARELAAKSHEARRRNKELRMLPEPEPQPMPQLTANPVANEVAQVREQIDALNVQLKDCEDPDTWDALTRSKERLFRIWARLAQLPMDPKPVQVKQPRTVPNRPEPQPVVVPPDITRPS